MAEIVNDIKVDLVEAVGSLGITLSSNNTRIRHTETGVFDISSDGSIEVVSGNGTSNNLGKAISITSGNGGSGVNGQDADNIAGGTITIQAGDGGVQGTSDTGGQGGSVIINGGEGNVGSDGANVVLEGGGGGPTGKEGRVVCNSSFKVVVFTNDAARDSINRPLPTTGDICFVQEGTAPAGNNKLQVYTGTVGGWQICN